MVAGLVAGMALSVVFQVAHCLEEAEFPLPPAIAGRIDNAWAVHQVETTVDFARRSRVVTWLVGGLNFQIEHHLFPRISHVHYPAISPARGTDLPRLWGQVHGVQVLPAQGSRRISGGCDGWGGRTPADDMALHGGNCALERNLRA